MKKITLLFSYLFLLLAAISSQQRIALLVGVNEYDDISILKLTTPRNDAKDLGALLGSAEGGWDKVFIMTDDQEYRSQDFPSKNKIMQRVSLIADLMKPADIVMLFFSGHGISDSEGAAWFLPIDTVFTDWKGTAIRLPAIVEAFHAKGINNVVLAVDACRESVSKTKGLSVVGIGGSNSTKIQTAETESLQSCLFPGLRVRHVPVQVP